MLLILGALGGGTLALVAVLFLVLGPIGALMVFWLGGLVATFALAVDFARKTVVGAIRPGASRLDGSDAP